MTDKKTKERFYLNFLLDYLKCDCKDIKNIEEKPDFKLIINNKKIGIELTRIFDTTGRYSLMAIESEHKKIADKLLVLYNKSVLPKIDILLSFVTSRPLPQKTNHEEYAWQVYNIILANFPTNDTYNSISDAQLLPKEMANIRIARYDFIENNFVGFTRYGWVIKYFQDLLQEIIKRKDKKITIYDKTCDEFWLLVYSDGGSGAAMFDPSVETLDFIYKSKFRRVFFISSINLKKIFELKIKQS